MNQAAAVIYLRESQAIGNGMYGVICPRCGRMLARPLARNALSRRVNLYICSDCGTEEAMLDMARKDPLPLDKWVLVREVMAD